MLRGKKSNAPFDDPGFVYLPGELLLFHQCGYEIDFPEASKQPYQCLALAIDPKKITDTLHFFKRKVSSDNQFWQLNYQNYFFYKILN
jgi:hypothetical protein